MKLFLVLIVVLLIGLTTAAVMGKIGGFMADPASSQSFAGLPAGPLSAGAIAQLHFDQALRGYRMEQVDEVIALRRHLHAHPEPSNEELETSLHLYQLLEKIDVEIRIGPEGCGVIADKKSAMMPEDADSPFPDGAQLCHKCHAKAVVFSDGCMTCLGCGDSKCS